VAQTLAFGESGFVITDGPGPGTKKLEVVEIGNRLFAANSDNTTIVGLEVTGTSSANRIEFNSSDASVTVNKLQARFFDGDDVLRILGNTRQSTISMGAGNDTFSTDAQFSSGSSINMGSGNDTARFTGLNLDPGANVLVNSTVLMGEGDDVLVFGGSTRGSTINLGSGADTVRFRANAVDTILNLGGDKDSDKVYLSARGNYDSLRIRGADNSDVLFIGSSEYKYRTTSNDWINVNDRTDVRTFNG
jgi:hypothetical protein